MAGAAGTPFRVFVELLEHLTAEKAGNRQNRLQTFFKVYGWGDFYPVYRLFLPQSDKDRRSYQMKETVIAKLYVEALAIEPTSEAGQVGLFRSLFVSSSLRSAC